MAKRYDDYPMGKLSDEELDQLLNYYDSSYSSKNIENIKHKIQLKKKEPIIFATFSKRKLLMIAIIVLFFFPVGTFIAAKLWEITVEKQDYQLTTKIDKTASQQPDTGNYRLVADYVPAYFIVNDDQGELSFYEEPDFTSDSAENLEALNNARGVTITLYELNKKDKVIDDYVKDYKEIKLSSGSAYIVEKLDDFAGKEATIARKFFEKENKFVELKCYGDISEKDIKKILDNLYLTNVATKEEATRAIEYMSPDDFSEKISKISEGIEPMMLDINNKSEVVQLNEAINTIDLNGNPLEELTVVKATLSDTIASKQLGILNKQIKAGTYDSNDSFGEEWDKKGKLKTMIATEYVLGDGKHTVNKEIREFEVRPKYLEIELKVKNLTEKTINYSPYIQVRRLAKQGDFYTDLPTDTTFIHKIPSDPFNTFYYLETPAYPLPTTVGKVVDHIVEEEVDAHPILPGETATFTVNYILANIEYSNLFLNLNAYSPGDRYIQLTQ